MKNLTKLWSLALLLTAAMFMVSCEEDEPTIDVTDGLSVADGIYIVAEGEDPVATMQLTSEQVEDEGFSAQERDGFVTGYFYLTSGNYNIVQTVDKEVNATIGGETETINYGTEDEPLTYNVVTGAADGAAAFNIEEGLYKIAYDELTSEIVIFEINTVGLIGAATPNGGSTDTPLSGSVNENGGSWTGSDIILRSGWYKFRFNSTWGIDRRIDTGAGFGSDNGYLMFTNFGGSIENLLPGNVGSNFEMTSETEGTYNVEVSYNLENGFEFSQERTGDAPEITFNPEDYQFGIIGNATAGGWDSDQDMQYIGEDAGTYKWATVVTFLADSAFKFRTNDSWDFNIGGTLTLDEASLSVNGNDFASPGTGAYYIEIWTSDEGETWEAKLVDAGWSLIGDGSPSGNWDNDTFLTAEGFQDGITTYTFTGDFAGGPFKLRAGGDWVYNLGGSIDALTFNGSDLDVAAGTYTLTLNFDGTSYSATLE